MANFLYIKNNWLDMSIIAGSSLHKAMLNTSQNHKIFIDINI